MIDRPRQTLIVTSKAMPLNRRIASTLSYTFTSLPPQTDHTHTVYTDYVIVRPLSTPQYRQWSNYNVVLTVTVCV